MLKLYFLGTNRKPLKSTPLLFLMSALLFMVASPVYAQQTTIITGTVADAETGEPLAFVNVFFKGTQIGGTTNPEGQYYIETRNPEDSLTATFVGYNAQTLAVKKGQRQTINFNLQPSTTSLDELVFVAGPNPAFAILDSVRSQRKKRDRRFLKAFEFDAYGKTRVDIDEISDGLRNSFLLKGIIADIDTMKGVIGPDGQTRIPVLITEQFTRVYQRNNPDFRKEIINQSRVKGVGFEQGTFIAQFTSSSFQDYNFYRNWVKLLEKDFVSPIAAGGRTYYEYDLIDSAMKDGREAYRLDFFPKREQDLAFTGTMWIDKADYALQSIDVHIGNRANLNFVDGLSIYQKMVPVSSGHWLPQRLHVVIDLAQPVKGTAAGRAVTDFVFSDFKVTEPYSANFYQQKIQFNSEAMKRRPADYWNEVRPLPLTEADEAAYGIINTLKQNKQVRFYEEVGNMASYGFKTWGIIDAGPVAQLYAFNNLEGHRVQIGGRTNGTFSNRWEIGGYAAYGSRDGLLKYSARLRYFLNQVKYTTISFEQRRDLDQVGLDPERLAENYIFLAASRFGTLNRPYFNTRQSLRFRTDWRPGLSQSLRLSSQTFEPLYAFGFEQPHEGAPGVVQSRYRNTELSTTIRYAPDEVLVRSENQRFSYGALRKPIMTLEYGAGLPGLIGGDFEYHRVRLGWDHRVTWGLLGKSRYRIDAGYFFNPLPYPLLEAHIGNPTPFYTTAAFQLMNVNEFISDRFLSVRYEHRFEGFMLNRIPLMRRLKWRLVANSNIIWGTLSRGSRDLIASTAPDGQPLEQFGSLDLAKPYIEVGYGVENIFKIFRFDFFHRLTYLDQPDASGFGIKFSAQVIL